MKLFFAGDSNAVTVPDTAEIPERYQQFVLPFANATWTDGTYGGYLRQEISSDHYLLTVFDFFIDKPYMLYARTDTPMIAFACILSGRFSCNLMTYGEIMLEEATNYIFYVPADAAHGVRFEAGHFRAFHFSLPASMLSEFVRDFKTIQPFMTLLDTRVSGQAQKLEIPFSLRTWALLDDILHYKSADGHLQSFMHARIFDLLVEYSKSLKQRGKQPLSGIALKSFAERLLIARHLIDDHTGKPLVIEEIARKSGLNSKQLKSGFRHMFNCTIGKYQLLRRMDRAVYLLTQTNQSIESICEHIGYDDRSSFTRKFKPLHKMTPLQYRLRYRRRELR